MRGVFKIELCRDQQTQYLVTISSGNRHVCVLLYYFAGRTDQMPQPAAPSVTPQDVKAIIERASKEPGINDVLALLRLSQESAQIDEFMRVLTTQPPIDAQVSGTAGWIR
jgi:hypothetical protein